MPKFLCTVLFAGCVLFAGGAAYAQHHGGHSQHPTTGPNAAVEDTRILVDLPPQLASHTLANMRDHLVALGEMSEYLAQGRYDDAARVSESRLGMTSLRDHGAHEVSKYMPQGMRDAGSAMHRAASRFAIEAQNAGATGDIKPALGVLSELIGACSGCHAGYRLR